MNYLVLIPSRPRFYRAKLTWVWNDVIGANILAPRRKWVKICLVNFQHLGLFQFLPRFELPTNRFEVKHRIHFTTQAESMACHQSENVRANFFALSRWSKKKQNKTKQRNRNQQLLKHLYYVWRSGLFMSGTSIDHEGNILLSKRAMIVQALLAVLPRIVDWKTLLENGQKVTLPWWFGGT